MYITLNLRFIECTSHKLYVTLKCTSHRMHVTLDACARLFEEILTFSVDGGGRRSETDPSNVEPSYVKLSSVEPSCVEWRMYVT